MRHRVNLVASAALVLSLIGAAAEAEADTIWYFTDVAFSDGGTLNGFLEVNQYGYLSDWKLTTSSGTGFNEYTYTPAINSSINHPTDTVVTFYHDNPAYYGYLQLTFANSLSSAAATNHILGGVGGPSLECGGWSCSTSPVTSPVRYISESQVATSAVPLPATLPLFSAALAGVAGLGGRRKFRINAV